MKERAADERSTIDADPQALESLGHGKACVRNGDHVCMHAHGAVLDKASREAEPALRFQDMGDVGTLVDEAGCATHGAGFRAGLLRFAHRAILKHICHRLAPHGCPLGANRHGCPALKHNVTIRVLSIRIEKKVNYFYEVTTSD